MLKLYSDIKTKETFFETWGSSTKHPDCRFRFSSFEKSNFCTDVAWNIPSWIYECASKMNFPYHADEFAKYGLMCSDLLREYEKRKYH